MIDSKYKTKNDKLIKPSYSLLLFNNKKNLTNETKALIKRLYLQIYRKPSSTFASIIQSLLWLILFSALFHKAPINMIGKYNVKYFSFLSYGLIIFTAFTSSVNTGLPIIFDREFGFFNRLLISPLMYKSTILFSLLTYALTISLIQVVFILATSIYVSKLVLPINNIITIINITCLVILNIANISITIGLILPGHIEFLAFTLLINLPALFSSTIIAPLNFMPYWLQIFACINPLTYATEIIRHICINKELAINIKIIENIWFQLNLAQSLTILIIINILSFIFTYIILQYKYN
uniref:ABC transmembrane type-2 domain-containing protein n=1 Tax=Caloglossa monosticha TaxID=76906 RepID=A0A1Z1M5C4_9FLOR|nr:hypothetical protein [Caloglossa monosticha]ARW61110.1 hypothetical protein [Caloglossa monosticha]